MDDFEPRGSVIRLRALLARRLAWVSLGGLLLLLGATLMLATVAVCCGAAAWAAIGAGEPLSTVLWVCAALASLALALVGLKALLQAGPPPEGISLPRAAAEDFFRVLDELAWRAGVEPVEHVRITDAVNASVVQRPALVLPGAMRTELLIGLPLVHCLSPVQFAAVLAHEFGHVAAQRRGWCGWAAFLRASWVRALDALLPAAPSASGASWLGGHADRFCHDMLRLGRIEELEADAVAAKLVGPALVGETLVALSRKAHFLQHDYWPRMHALRSADANSAVRPFREMGHGFAAGFSDEAVAADPALALDEARPGCFHPSLRRRLRALRVSAAAMPVESSSAASHFFSGLLPSLAWIFDRVWWEGARIRRHSMVVPDEDRA
jgi:Zn-dependent protease with chaperone function